MKKKFDFHMLPALLILCILPFCIRLHMIEIDLDQYPWFLNKNQWGDFFLFARSRMILWVAGLAVLIMLDAFFLQRQKIHVQKRWFLLGGYLFFCILSAVFSDKKEVAFLGGIEQFEGLWVILAYGVICFYGYSIAKRRQNNRLLYDLIVITCFALSMIGVLQMAGKDILQTDAIISLMIPESLEKYRNQISFNFTNESMHLAYMTLYNPNYVGSFAVLCVPILIDVFLKTKQMAKKIFVFVTYLFLMISLVGSQSKAGIVICIFIQLLMLIMWITSQMKERKREKRLVIAGFVFFSVCIFIWVSIFYAGKEMNEMDASLDSISLDEKGIEISYKQSILKIDYRMAEDMVIPVFRDGNGLEPPCEYDVTNKEYLIQDENLKELRIGCYEKQGVVQIYIAYKDYQWLFVDEDENHMFSYVTIYGKTDTIEEAFSVFPKGFDSLYTYRGYIWGRTIPLLQNKILWGSGPDTFIYEFPQNDYVNRSHGKQGFFKEILTKPHSMYLQMALQTGVGSLVCFVLFVGHTLKDAFVFTCYRFQCLMYSVVGYMLVGIFNDSTITVAPIFWLILGLLTGYVEQATDDSCHNINKGGVVT